MKKWIMLLFLLSLTSLHAEVLKWTDAFNRDLIVNPDNQVTVILYSNQELDKTTRYMNAQLDAFKGKENFRCYVLLDMRKSLGNKVKPLVRSQVRDNLRSEAKRVRPFFKKNGNSNDPLNEITVFIDFDGAKCDPLGWEPNAEMKAAVFNKKGELESNWTPLENSKDLYQVVQKLLQGKQ
jgi:hypothetical protein